MSEKQLDAFDVAASGLDSPTRDVPPTALGPAEKVEQPAEVTMRAADRAGPSQEGVAVSADERTRPLPALDAWAEEFARGVTP